MKVGFIGLGRMGSNMCANVIKHGHEVYAYDVFAPAIEKMVEKGAKAATSYQDLAGKVDAIMMSLPNAPIVAGAVQQLLEGAKPGLLIIDLSSITPNTIQKLAEDGAKQGVTVIDAPVSGGMAGAEAGTLSIMVGASDEDFEKARPLLECVGSPEKIQHVGGVGAGDATKMVNNLLLGVNMAAVGEALALGVKCGVKADTLYDVISKSSGCSYALTAKYGSFISKRNFEPGFMIDLQHKDLGMAVDTAKAMHVPLMMGNVAQQLYDVARAKGMGKEDISAILKLSEELYGVEV